MKILLTALVLNLVLISNVIAEWEECYSPRGGGFTSFAVEGDTILAGTRHASASNSGIFKSTDFGLNWTKLKTDFDTNSFYNLININGKFFVGTDDAVYFTTDCGVNWTLSLQYGVYPGSTPIVEYKDYLLLGSNDGLYKSTDMGSSWLKLNITPPVVGTFRSFYQSNGKLWGLISSIIYEYNDIEDTWNLTGSFHNSAIYALDGKLYAFNRNVYSSSNGGKSWDSLSSDIRRPNQAYSWHYSDGKMYLGTRQSGIFESSDFGKSWKSYGLEFSQVNGIVKTKKGIIASTFFSGIFTSVDDGKTWSKFGYDFIHSNKIDYDDNLLVAATRDGLYKSIDSGKTWFYDSFNACNVASTVLINQKQMVSVMPRIDNIDSENWEFSPSGVYVSFDLGHNWIHKHNFLQNSPINTLVYNKGRILSGNKSGLFVTDDFGDTWIETLRFKNYIHQILVVEDAIYTCPIYRVYVTSDNGDSWNKVNELGENYTSVPTIRRVGNMIFVDMNPGERHFYISYDLGKSWSFTDKAPAHLPHIVNKDSSIIFTIYDEKVLFSTDQGLTWIDYDVGLLSKAFRITFFGGYIIVENGNGMFRKKISDFEKITSVQNEVIQNSISIHPNPATEYIEIAVDINPTVNRRVDEDSDIKIFNTLGECVKNLTPTLSQGEGVRIDISHLPRGVYYIRIGNRTQMFVKV